MLNIANIEFANLDISGNNYLSWILDAETHLEANRLSETIKEGNQEALENPAKALLFLHYHLDDGLKRNISILEILLNSGKT